MEGSETPTSREPSLGRMKPVSRRRKSVMSQCDSNESDLMDKVTPPISAEARTLRERSFDKTKAKVVPRRRKSAMSQSEMDVMNKVTSPFLAEAPALREPSLFETKPVPQRRKSVISQSEIDVMDKVTSLFSAQAPALRERSLDKTRAKAVPQRRKSVTSELEIEVMDKATYVFSAEAPALREPSLHKPKAVSQRRKSALMRQLEIDMTEKVKSPLPAPDNGSVSRYGRARKVRCLDSPPENASPRPAKSPKIAARSVSPARSPTVYRMNASNSPVKVVTSNSNVLDPIDDFKQTNNRLSDCAEASPKIRRKSAQNREEKTGSLLKCMFSPVKSKSPHNSTRLNIILQRSPDNFDIEKPVVSSPMKSEKKVILTGAVKKFSSPIISKRSEKKSPKTVHAERKTLSPRQQGLIEHPSVIKTLDFNDSPKNAIRIDKTLETNIPAQPAVTFIYDPDYEEMEKNCKFQANDLAWARVGTYPFWPCLITRDPYTGWIVKKKGSSRNARPVHLIHVSYLADNGRRGWITVSMLREFHGLHEFEEARNAITPERKKKDPKLYAAFFISDKSRKTWDLAVKEAEILLATPNFSRIDVLYEMVYKPNKQISKEVVTNIPRKEKKRVSNENRRISLSASLLDTLFSEGPSKTDEKDKSKSTLDVSDVVTACLDDMATKTGNIKIQKQSHMDRWLQKAKSKTPEKAVENAKIAAQNTYSRKKKRDGTSDDTELSHPIQSAKRRLRSSSKYSLRADSSSGLDFEESKTSSLDEKLPRFSVSTEINQRESCSPVLAVETHEEQGFVPMTESKINKDNAICIQPTASKISSDSGTNKKNYNIVVANPADDNNKNTVPKMAQPESECSTDNDDLNIILKMDENSFDSDVSPEKKNRKVTNSKQHETIEPVNIIEKNKFAHLNNDHTYDDKPASDGNADLGNFNKKLQNENHNNMVQSFLTGPENADESSVSSSSMSAEGPMYIAIVVENSTESFGDSQSSASIINTEIDTKCQAVSVKDTISTNGDKTIGGINNFGNKSQDFPNLMNNHIDCNLGNENPKESANYAEEVISQLDGEDLASNKNIEDFDKTSVDSLDICIAKDNVPIIENNCKRNRDLESSGNTIIISNNIRNDHNYFHMAANVSLVKCAVKERKLEETVQFEVTSEDKETQDSEEKSQTSIPVLNFDSCNENSLTKKSLIEALHVKSDSYTESSKHIQTTNTIIIERAQTIESSETDILEINNTIQSNEIGSTKQDFVDFEPDSDTESGKANNHFLDALSEDSSSSGSEIFKNTNQNMITPKLSLMDESSEVHGRSNEIDNMKTYTRQDDEDVMLTADTLEPIEIREMSDSDSEEFPETDSSRPESEIIEKIEVNMKKITAYLYTETSDVDTRESSIDGELNIHENLESAPIIGNFSTDDSESNIPCNIKVVHDIEQDVKFQDKDTMPISDTLSINDPKSSSQCDIEAVHCIERDIQEKKEAIPENYAESIDEFKCDSSYEAEPTKRINENLEPFSILGILSTDDSMSQCNIEAVHCIEQDVKFQEEKQTIPVNDTQSINNPKCDSSCEAKPTKTIHATLESVSIVGILSTGDSESNIPCYKEVVHDIEQDVKFQDKDTMPLSDTQSINDPKCESSCEAKPMKRIHANLESFSVVGTLSTDNSKSTSPCNIETTHCIEQELKFQKEKDTMPVNIMKDPKCDSSCEAEPTNSIHKNLESVSKGSFSKVSPCNVKVFHCTEQNIKFLERKDKTCVNDTQSIEESTSDDESETRNPSTRNVGADSKIEERLCVNDGKNDNEAKSAKSCDKAVAKDDLKIQENSTPSETTDNTVKSSTSTSSSFVNHTEINKNATVCKVDFQSANEFKNTRPSKVKCLDEKVDDSSDNDSTDDISCDIIPKNVIENDIKIKVNSKVICANDILSTDSPKSASLGEVNSEIHIHKTEVSNSSINYKVDSREPASTSIEKRTSSRVKAKDNTDVSSDGLQKDICTENVTRRSVDTIKNKTYLSNYDDPDFMSYVETKKSMVMEKYPNITAEDSITFLYSIWLLSNDNKLEKEINIKSENPVIEETAKPKRKSRPKEIDYGEIIIPKDKPVRKSSVKTYFENFSDSESELDNETAKIDEVEQVKSEEEGTAEMNVSEIAMDESWFMNELTKPKPNLFKGLIKERLCEICELPGDIVKCKGHCGGMYHTDCVRRQAEPQPEASRKKKKKQGRPRKSAGDSDQSSDGEKSQEVSLDEMDLLKSFTVENENFETQLAEKMVLELEKEQNIDLDLYSTDEDLDWDDVTPGQCEIVNVELRLRSERKNDDLQYFKCNNCQNYYQSPCFICKSVESPKHKTQSRQKCSVMHCSKVYHLECLDHWPQTQFSSGGLNKESEAITCPRHVCHTCVCDDPRGCKTRFSGDKLARCVRCPAVYHSFTKCLPAGTKILNGSHIICPRHYEQKPGKVPYHVNTSWCFICATGGTLICCEYCPMSFHADCLNIQPPEDGYMCEDCETGRLPLYGEMVWAKLGNYRWWPGLILHPHLVPDNVTLLKHSTTGEFVVRFFGGNDHFWLYRGRVFPYQEGDTGKCSTQKSKIDTEFAMAVEQAQRMYKILKEAKDNEEESVDIASSMLPPHYVKLKVNKPHGSLAGRRVDVDEENSGTQCDCRPDEDEPCSAYSQCLNRVLLTECGPACRAGDRCNNRNFEKRNYPKLAPRRTPQRGWGLHTLEDIKKGQFVIEYVGELIDDEEFRRRMRRKHETRDENYYFLTLDKDRMIDAGPKGNAARFMNHCCEPNCETQKWTVLGDVRVGLFAICDIPANSEVTFNYNLECASVDKKKCLCGAGRCAGYIGAKPKQEEPQVKKPKRKYNKKPRVESPSTSAKTPPVRKYRSSNTSLNASLLSNNLLEIEQDLLIIQNATRNMPIDGELDTNKINNEAKPIHAEAKEMIVDVIKLTSPTTECKKVENRSPKIVKEAKVKMSFDEEMMKIDNYTLKKQKEKKDKTLSPDGKVNVGESPKKKRIDEIVKVNGIEDEKEKIKSKKTTVEKLEKLKSPGDGHNNKIHGHRKEKKPSDSREKIKELQEVATKLDKVEKKVEEIKERTTCPEKRAEERCEKSVSECLTKNGSEAADVAVKMRSKKTMKRTALTDGEMNGFESTRELRVSVERCDVQPHAKDEKRALKRKRVSFSSEEIVISYDESTGEKKTEVKKTEEKDTDVKKAKTKAGSTYEQVFFEFLKKDTTPVPGNFTKSRKLKRLDNV